MERRWCAQNPRPGRQGAKRPGLLRAAACRVVGLKHTTNFLQQYRHPSDCDVCRLLRTDVVTELHVASRSTYGVRRMKASLWHESGLVVNRKLIRRIVC